MRARIAEGAVNIIKVNTEVGSGTEAGPRVKEGPGTMFGMAGGELMTKEEYVKSLAVQEEGKKVDVRGKITRMGGHGEAKSVGKLSSLSEKTMMVEPLPSLTKKRGLLSRLLGR